MRLKLKRIYTGHMPSRSEFVDMIGPRVMNRTQAAVPKDSAETQHPDPEYFPAGHDDATLVTSLLPTGNHMPVIDIDLESMLVPSTTPGHFHLYINCAMSWKQYRKLLRVMRDVGIVQNGYYEHSIRRGRSFVRYPGVTKQNEQARIEETQGEAPF